MQAVARSHFARYSPRKVGRILDLIRGKSVTFGYGILSNVPGVSRELVQKTLKSAVSNMGKGIDINNVFVREAWVNKGPVLKRVRAMAMGGRGLYRRKTCHLTIIVTDENKGRKK